MKYPTEPTMPSWHKLPDTTVRGRAPKINAKYKPGQVVKYKTAMSATVVTDIQGPGWVAYTDLRKMLCRPLGQIALPGFVKRCAIESALLLPYLQRYYRFTPEGWEQLLAHVVEKALKEK